MNNSQDSTRKKVVIVGAGFAGLNAAKQLSHRKDIDVVVIDRENHHLFQPLLYQVAMAALSPADIAVPIRSLLNAANLHQGYGTVHRRRAPLRRHRRRRVCLRLCAACLRCPALVFRQMKIGSHWHRA